MPARRPGQAWWSCCWRASNWKTKGPEPCGVRALSWVIRCEVLLSSLGPAVDPHSQSVMAWVWWARQRVAHWADSGWIYATVLYTRTANAQRPLCTSVRPWR